MSARRKAKGIPPLKTLEGDDALKSMVEELAEIVRAASGKPLDEEGLAYLSRSVKAVRTNYGALQFATDDASDSTAHELASLLPRVIEVIKDNESELAFTLGREEHNFSCDIEYGVERLEALVADLQKLAAIRPPKGRDQGRPENADLHQLVHQLANDWVYLTGTDFTQEWNRDGSPKSRGAQFIRAVVGFGARKMTERVVKERREGKVMVGSRLLPLNAKRANN